MSEELSNIEDQFNYLNGNLFSTIASLSTKQAANVSQYMCVCMHVWCVGVSVTCGWLGAYVN